MKVMIIQVWQKWMLLYISVNIGVEYIKYRGKNTLSLCSIKATFYRMLRQWCCWGGKGSKSKDFRVLQEICKCAFMVDLDVICFRLNCDGVTGK